MITQKRLKEVLVYDLDSGMFVWKNTLGRSKKGSEAGSVHSFGYRYIQIDKKQYRAHRLAWLYCYGELPAGDLDHVNGDRADNRIVNLRVTTAAENQRNRKTNKNNKIGFNGVSFLESQSVFVARVKVEGKSITLGRTKDLVSAIILRMKANKKYGFLGDHLKSRKSYIN
jgi:hypothetical protein